MPRCRAPKPRNPPTCVGKQGIRKPRRCDEGTEEPSAENVGKSPVYLPEIGKYRCRFCANTYKLVKNARRHQETHGDERKHLCTICDKGFPRTDVMNNHYCKCFNIRNGRFPTEEEMPRKRQRAATARRDEMAQTIQPNQAVQPTQPAGAEQALFNGLLDTNHLANFNGSYQWPIDWHHPNAGFHLGAQAADGVINGGPASMEPFMWDTMQLNQDLRETQGQPFNAAFSGAQGQPIFGPTGPALGVQQQLSSPYFSTPSPTSSGPTFSNSGTPFTSMSPQSGSYFPTAEGPQPAPVTNLQYQHAEPHQAPPDFETSMNLALQQGLSRNVSEVAVVNELPAELQYISPDHAAGWSSDGQEPYQYAPEAAAVNEQPGNGGIADMQDASTFMDTSRQQSGIPMDMNAPAFANTFSSDLLPADLFYQSSNFNSGDFGAGPHPMDQFSGFDLWTEPLAPLFPGNQYSSLGNEQMSRLPPEECGLA